MFVNGMKNEGKAYAVFKVFNGIFMLFIILVTLVPYITILAKAFNEGTDTMRGGVGLWPRVFTVENFRVLLADTSMYKAFFVTICKVLCQVIGGVLVQFMAGYALSRKNLWGMKIINLVYLIPMYISGGMMAHYILYSKIGLLDNFWVYVLPTLWNFYNVIIIRTYMQTNIPDAIIEAARIDGAQEWTLFSRIILPLSKPILATIVLWIAVHAWNEWTSTLYYIQNPDLHTLQYKLMQTLKQTERMKALLMEAIKSGENPEAIARSMKVTGEAIQSAQVVIVTVPIIIVYPFIQKYFVGGITLGSVKG